MSFKFEQLDVLIETVACQRLIMRRKYINDKALMDNLDLKAQELARRLQSFRKSLTKPNKSIGEEQHSYETGIF